MKRSSLFLIIASLLHLSISASEVKLFHPNELRLEDDELKRSVALGLEYVMQHDPDRLLAPYRKAAGLEAKAEAYGNWESTGLAGHSAGHFLSALAYLHVETGSAEALERLRYMLSELAECQAAHGDGYVGGVDGGQRVWKEVAGGKIEAQRFALNGAWVPWYNLHKTYLGLWDAWQVAEQESAKEMLLALTDWTYETFEGLTDEQFEAMLYAEHGGMNDVFAALYQVTGDEKHLHMAKRFSHREILSFLSEEEDQLTGLHANTQIPKVTGFQRVAAASGDKEYATAARFFWETVVDRRSVAIGGNSVREHFHPVDDFGPMIESREGPESCNTYNMLRLSAQLFLSQPESRIADFYERALMNHILSLQHPDTGGLVYFTPMRPRHYRVYSQAETAFWCCVGSGIENPGRYTEFIYARDEDSLYWNLFLSSSVEWKEKGVSLRQESQLPERGSSTLFISVEQPVEFELMVRRPAWVGEGFAVEINGERMDAAVGDSGYVSISRIWSDGDTARLIMPMTVRTEQMPDGSDYFAFLYGPTVLAARSSGGDLPGLFAGDGRMEHIAPGTYLPLHVAPTLIGDPKHLASRLKPVEGKPLRFALSGRVEPKQEQELILEPFAGIHESRYSVYFRATDDASFERDLEKRREEEQVQAALRERTIDSVTPGEQQPEVEHDYAGEGDSMGSLFGRAFRQSSEWFEYTLKAGEATNLELAITSFGSEWGRSCDVYLNGTLVGSIVSRGQHPERFVEAVFPVPDEALAPELRLRIQAKDGELTPALYEIALRERAESD